MITYSLLACPIMAPDKWVSVFSHPLTYCKLIRWSVECRSSAIGKKYPGRFYKTHRTGGRIQILKPLDSSICVLVRVVRPINQGMTTARPKTLRGSICGPAETTEGGNLVALEEPLTGAVHHMGSLVSGGLEAVLMTACRERGPGSRRAEVSALD